MMRILGSIVKLSTAFTAFYESKLTGCSPIRAQIICDELVLEKAIFLQKLAHQMSTIRVFLPVWTARQR